MRVLRRSSTDNPAKGLNVLYITPRGGKTSEEVWKEREKRLETLLEKDHGPNPKAREDFDRLLEEMVRRNSR